MASSEFEAIRAEHAKREAAKETARAAEGSDGDKLSRIEKLLEKILAELRSQSQAEATKAALGQKIR